MWWKAMAPTATSMLADGSGDSMRLRASALTSTCWAVRALAVNQATIPTDRSTPKTESVIADNGRSIESVKGPLRGGPLTLSDLQWLNPHGRRRHLYSSAIVGDVVVELAPAQSHQGHGGEPARDDARSCEVLHSASRRESGLALVDDSSGWDSARRWVCLHGRHNGGVARPRRSAEHGNRGTGTFCLHV